MNDDKTSRRAAAMAGVHRTLLRVAALVFIFLGANVLLPVLFFPLAQSQPGVTPATLAEQAISGLVVAGAGVLLYRVAPHLMD